MPEPVVTAVLAAAVVAAWMWGLLALDAFTPADARAWKQLRTLRGLTSGHIRVAGSPRLGRLIQRLQTRLDLERRLALAGRSATPTAFLLRAAGIGCLAFALVLGIDGIGAGIAGTWPVPPVAAVLVGIAMPLLSLYELRIAALRRQTLAAMTLGDAMILTAVMTDARGLALDDAVRILSRCTDNTALRELVDARGYSRRIRTQPRSTIRLYGLIADEYEIPIFRQVAEAAATANVGVPERDVYTRLALSVYRERLLASRVRASRAKVLVTLPVAGMLVPLLIIIGAPTFDAISRGVQGG